MKPSAEHYCFCHCCSCLESLVRATALPGYLLSEKQPAAAGGHEEEAPPSLLGGQLRPPSSGSVGLRSQLCQFLPKVVPVGSQDNVSWLAKH